MLEIFGPQGWFKNLEELSLPRLDTRCLESGVIPQFDLPRLRNFFLSTKPFYDIGAPDREENPFQFDEDWDEYYSHPRPWDGLPDYLPGNALPNSQSPLERFVWHSEDDCDYFNDEDWYWRGPTMESLRKQLGTRDLKQVEVVVDYDDHENGAEGVIAAPYQQNPFELFPALEHVTIDEDDLRLLEPESQQIKRLRVYGFGFTQYLFTLLGKPICSELESLHFVARGGYWGPETLDVPHTDLPQLKSLFLSWKLLGLFSNCQFTNLIQLLGHHSLKLVMERKWPKLQSLCVNIDSDDIPDLKAFAKSDCCPELTTLTIVLGYGIRDELDISFLANCPHMPFLSLIRIPDFPVSRDYIVDRVQVLPVRSDIMLDELTPMRSYHISAVF
ncbi:MAG: hypothetical protein KDA84_28650 [Planctomycetaceae bacterium]|nr:hypothetical protein [Planctomycetaceae bacterium]